jgi:uncharacterized protein
VSPPKQRRAGRCPQCGNPAEPGPDNAFRPFCSERCKLADLGQWFAGRYAIPTEEDPELPMEAPPDPQSRQ